MTVKDVMHEGHPGYKQTFATSWSNVRNGRWVQLIDSTLLSFMAQLLFSNSIVSHRVEVIKLAPCLNVACLHS